MHTVIVGGGFAGIKTALELSRRNIGKITLISDHSYFLHHATLYATATGRNSAESVIPLDVIFANHPSVKLVEDSIVSLDPRRKLVSSKNRDYSYDKLVLALGSVTTFFGIPGMNHYSFGIKTLEDMQEFHSHLHQEVVQNKLDKNVFVIGCGQTGVELAGALTTYLDNLKKVHHLKNSDSKVTLVEAGPRVVPRMSSTASRVIGNQLHKQGVRILTGHQVDMVSADTITINGREHQTTTAIWTSGVANHPFFAHNSTHFKLAKNGRVDVNPYLEASDNIYVIGDNNNVRYSGTAVPAMKQAVHVAKNIARVASMRAQRPFRPHSVPSGVPISDNWGYVEWHGIYVKGRSGHAARRLMELHGYCQLLPFKTAVAAWRSHNLYDVDI